MVAGAHGSPSCPPRVGVLSAQTHNKWHLTRTVLRCVGLGARGGVFWLHVHLSTCAQAHCRPSTCWLHAILQVLWSCGVPLPGHPSPLHPCDQRAPQSHDLHPGPSVSESAGRSAAHVPAHMAEPGTRKGPRLHAWCTGLFTRILTQASTLPQLPAASGAAAGIQSPRPAGGLPRPVGTSAPWLGRLHFLPCSEGHQCPGKKSIQAPRGAPG